jgi:hypothetical protein
MRKSFFVFVSMVASATAALAQSPTPSGDPIATQSRGAWFLLDRGVGQGKIEIRCATNEATRVCLEVALPLISGWQQGQGGVVYATTSLKCGNDVYTVSTGTNSGACGPTAGGGGKSVTCTSGGNTVASASCDAGCGTQTGAGSCTLK